MIYIKKTCAASQDYHNWYVNHSHLPWESIKTAKKNILRNMILKEQGFICCFCGSKIGNVLNGNIILQESVRPNQHNIRMAHITPRSSCLCSQLDYQNICASCNAEGGTHIHCDISQDSCVLPITPLQENCLSYFYFNSLGRINPNPNLSNDEQAKAFETIKILNLNSDNLEISRREIIEEFEDAFSDVLENDELYNELYTKLVTKDANGIYNEFYFIVIANYPAPIV